MYRNRPLDLCRPTFFEVTPRVLRQRASNTRRSGLGAPRIGVRSAGAHVHARTYTRMCRPVTPQVIPTHASAWPTRTHARAHARPPGRRAHARLADAHAHTYARVPARTRPRSARHAVGMTHENVGISAPDRPPRPPRRRGDGRRCPPSPPSIGPPGEIGHRFARRQSAQTRRLGRKRNAGGIFGGESIPLSHPRGRSGRGGPVFGRAPGRWLSDGHTFFLPAASAHPHTPLYARAR